MDSLLSQFWPLTDAPGHPRLRFDCLVDWHVSFLLFVCDIEQSCDTELTKLNLRRRTDPAARTRENAADAARAREATESP